MTVVEINAMIAKIKDLNKNAADLHNKKGEAKYAENKTLLQGQIHTLLVTELNLKLTEAETAVLINKDIKKVHITPSTFNLHISLIDILNSAEQNLVQLKITTEASHAKIVAPDPATAPISVPAAPVVAETIKPDPTTVPVSVPVAPKIVERNLTAIPVSVPAAPVVAETMKPDHTTVPLSVPVAPKIVKRDLTAIPVSVPAAPVVTKTIKPAPASTTAPAPAAPVVTKAVDLASTNLPEHAAEAPIAAKPVTPRQTIQPLTTEAELTQAIKKFNDLKIEIESFKAAKSSKTEATYDEGKKNLQKKLTTLINESGLTLTKKEHATLAKEKPASNITPIMEILSNALNELNSSHKKANDEALKSARSQSTERPKGPASTNQPIQSQYPSPTEAELKATAETRAVKLEQEKREASIKEFNNLVTKLENKVSELNSKNPSPFQSQKAADDIADAHTKGSQLIIELRTLSAKFVNDHTMSVRDFEAACKTSFNGTDGEEKSAKSALERQPGFTNLINNILFWLTNVISIGMVPLVAQISTGNARFSFFNAKPMEAGLAADEIQENVSRMAAQG